MIMNNSKLYFYYGTMGSSKSLRLLTTAYNFEEKGISFIILKSEIDTRESNCVVRSRIGIERPCTIVRKNEDIYTLINNYNNSSNLKKKLEWVLIDECQFLTSSQVEQLSRIVDELNINVMCFGLKTDFQSHLFEGSKRLFELSDVLEEVKSRCECGNKTSINARFDHNGNLLLDGDQIVIGDEIYKPLCRKCWMKLKQDNETKLL